MQQEYVQAIQQGLIYFSLATLAGAYVLKTIRDCRIVEEDLSRISMWREERDRLLIESNLEKQVSQ